MHQRKQVAAVAAVMVAQVLSVLAQQAAQVARQERTTTQVAPFRIRVVAVVAALRQVARQVQAAVTAAEMRLGLTPPTIVAAAVAAAQVRTTVAMAVLVVSSFAG